MREKEFTLIGGKKSLKLFFEYLIKDSISVATFTKYLLKAFALFCSSVKLRPLSETLDRTTLDNFFKEIRFFISFHVFFKLFRLFWK